jgi:hypothetical protein
MPLGTLTRTAGENIGNYAITQGNLGAGSNYDISYVSKILVSQPNLLLLRQMLHKPKYMELQTQFTLILFQV